MLNLKIFGFPMIYLALFWAGKTIIISGFFAIDATLLRQTVWVSIATFYATAVVIQLWRDGCVGRVTEKTIRGGDVA